MICIPKGFKEKRNTKIILLITFIKSLQFQQTARLEKEKKNECPKTIFITTKKMVEKFHIWRNKLLKTCVFIEIEKELKQDSYIALVIHNESGDSRPNVDAGSHSIQHKEISCIHIKLTTYGFRSTYGCQKELKIRTKLCPTHLSIIDTSTYFP